MDDKKLFNRKFGKLCRKYRTEKGLSQESLALDGNMDRTYISLIERGLQAPTVYKLFSICHILDVKPNEFIRELERVVYK